MLLYSCICVNLNAGGNMAKLKTLLLLALTGFILVGCGDSRGEDKKKLVDMLVIAQDVTRDQAECAVDALSDNLGDKAWEGLMLTIDGTRDERKAFEDGLSEEDEKDLEAEFLSATAATLECDGIDRPMF